MLSGNVSQRSIPVTFATEERLTRLAHQQRVLLEEQTLPTVMETNRSSQLDIQDTVQRRHYSPSKFAHDLGTMPARQSFFIADAGSSHQAYKNSKTDGSTLMGSHREEEYNQYMISNDCERRKSAQRFFSFSHNLVPRDNSKKRPPL